MTQPFLGQISAFGFGFPPRGWSLCNGQLVMINQNPALFSLLGTTYGGDGRTTFGLPNLQGRAGVSFGQGPGLSNYVQGQVSGVENVALTVNQMPAHIHTWTASNTLGNQPAPAGNFLAGGKIPNGTPIPAYAAVNPATVPLNAAMLGNVGGNTAHNNMQPFLVVNYCVATSGIFPSRN